MNSFNHQLKGPWAFDDSNIPVTYDEIYQKHYTDSSPNNNRSIEVFNRATADQTEVAYLQTTNPAERWFSENFQDSTLKNDIPEIRDLNIL